LNVIRFEEESFAELRSAWTGQRPVPTRAVSAQAVLASRGRLIA